LQQRRQQAPQQLQYQPRFLNRHDLAYLMYRCIILLINYCRERRKTKRRHGNVIFEIYQSTPHICLLFPSIAVMQDLFHNSENRTDSLFPPAEDFFNAQTTTFPANGVINGNTTSAIWPSTSALLSPPPPLPAGDRPPPQWTLLSEEEEDIEKERYLNTLSAKLVALKKKPTSVEAILDLPQVDPHRSAAGPDIDLFEEYEFSHSDQSLLGSSGPVVQALPPLANDAEGEDLLADERSAGVLEYDIDSLKSTPERCLDRCWPSDDHSTTSWRRRVYDRTCFSALLHWIGRCGGARV